MDILKKLKSFFEHMAKSSGVISGMLILCMAVIVFVEVALRYLFNRPSIYTLDIVAGFVLASVFAGGSYALLVEGHVKVDLFFTRFPEKMQRTLTLLNYIFVFLYASVFTWQAFTVAWKSIQFDWRSESIVFPYPLWPLFFIMGLGMLLFSIQAILKIISSFSIILKRKNDNPQITN